MPYYCKAHIGLAGYDQGDMGQAWSVGKIVSNIPFTYPVDTSRLLLQKMTSFGLGKFNTWYTPTTGNEMITSCTLYGYSYKENSWNNTRAISLTRSLSIPSGPQNQLNEPCGTNNLTDGHTESDFDYNIVCSMKGATTTYTENQFKGIADASQDAIAQVRHFSVFPYDTVAKDFVTIDQVLASGQQEIGASNPKTAGTISGNNRYVLLLLTEADAGPPPDSIAPTVTIVPTSSGSSINGTFYTSSNPANFTISAVDNAGGTGVKHIVINGVTYAVTSRTHTVSGSGLTTITASAEDYVGNITPNVTYDVFIDQTAPSVAIQSQNPIVVGGTRDYHNSSSVDIQIDTSDSDSGLDDGDLIINGSTTTFATIPTQTSYTTTINSAQGIVEGLNTVEYVSKDIVGNQNTANTTFYVDITAPDGYIVFSSQNKIRLNGGIYYTNLTEVDVDLHFGDSGSYPSGVSKGLIRVNNTATPTVADFVSGIDFSSDTSPRTSYNVTGLVNGQVNTLTFFVMDSAENISTGDTISVTVEQINPSGSIQISSLETPKITKSTTNYINDDTVELNLTHSDSESDLF